MAKPLKDPIDEEADEAEGKSVAKHAGALAERIASAREADEPESFEVEEPEETDEVDEVAPSRRDRRAARQTNRERLAAAEARAATLEEVLKSGRQGGPDAPRAPAAPNQAAVQQAENFYGQVLTEQETLFKEYHSKQNLTDAEDKDYRRRAAVLDLKKTRAALQVDEAYRAPQRAQEEHNRQNAARHPDVYGNNAALQYATGEFNKRVARGEPDNIETHDAAMEEARQVILGKRPRPDAAQRARATGMSSGGKATGAVDRPKIDMPKGSHQYRMAVAMYPNLEPAQACQKWVNQHGAKLQAIRQTR